MRALVRLIDTLLRRANGVYEFTDDVDCMLRIRLTRAPEILRFPGREVPRGEPVLELHLWNEHVPPIPADGPDLTWASQMRRTFVASLRAVAREMEGDPHLAGVRALGGTTVALVPDDSSSGVRVMQRLGFVVWPFRWRFGRFSEFWDNLFGWGLMWTFNPTSLRHRRFPQTRRINMWMPADEFRRRYGSDRSLPTD